MLRCCLVAVGLVVAALPVQAGWPEGIPGAEVGRIVRGAMASAGVADRGRFADPVRAFPPCAGTPEVRPLAGDWATAEVRCTGPVWRRALRTGAEPAAVFVGRGPEAASGPLVVTLVRSLAKGAMIGAGDVALQPMSARGAQEIFTDAADVIGRRARVALGEGQPVLLRQLEPAWLVETGNPLALTAHAGGVRVTMAGEALGDGQMGDVIDVRNLSSGREVRAVVTGPNIVTVQTNMR